MRALLRRGRRRPSGMSLLTRPGCTQCARVAPMVQRLAAEHGVPLQVLDVDKGSAADLDRWGDRVPVVLLDGREHASWQIDERALRRALSGR